MAAVGPPSGRKKLSTCLYIHDQEAFHQSGLPPLPTDLEYDISPVPYAFDRVVALVYDPAALAIARDMEEAHAGEVVIWAWLLREQLAYIAEDKFHVFYEAPTLAELDAVLGIPPAQTGMTKLFWELEKAFGFERLPTLTGKSGA